MAEHRIFAMPFAKVYPLYVQKAERKDRTKEEVDQVICWLTGFDQATLAEHLKAETTFEDFFAATDHSYDFAWESPDYMVPTDPEKAFARFRQQLRIVSQRGFPPRIASWTGGTTPTVRLGSRRQGLHRHSLVASKTHESHTRFRERRTECQTSCFS